MLKLNLTEEHKNILSPPENFLVLAESSPDVILKFDHFCQIIYTNTRIKDYTDATDVELIGKTVEGFGFSIPFSKWINKSIRKVIKTGAKNSIRFKSINHYFDCYLMPEFSKWGQVQAVLAIARDITEIKKAEEAIVASEKKFRALAEASHDVIMKFDSNLRHIYVNSKVEDITGIPAEQFIGRTHEEMGFPQHLVEIWDRAIVGVLNSGIQGRIEFLLPDGIYMDWLLCPEFDEKGHKVQAVITTARDITERKKAEDVLKTSEKNFRSLLDASPELIIKLDTHKRHLYVNAAVEKLSGKSASEIIGKTHRELGFSVSRAALWNELIDKVIDTKQTIRREFKIATGEIMDWYLVPDFDEQGNVSAIIATARDISSLKRTEEELRQSNDKLEDAMKIANICTYEVDFKKNLITLNPGLCKLLNIDLKSEFSSSDFLQHFVHPEDRDKILNAYTAAQDASDNDSLHYVEYRLLREEKTIHILSSVRTVKGRSGDLLKAYGTSQDITYLRKNEEELEIYKLNLERLVETRTLELRRSEARLSDALKLASLGTWEFDFNSNLYVVGDEVLQMLGSDVATENSNSFSYERFQQLIHPDEWERFEKRNQQILSEKDPDFLSYLEHRVIRTDGEIRNLYISIKIVLNPDGRHLKHYGTIQDITDIRNVEAERGRLNAIVEATSDIVCISDMDGEIIYLNQTGKDFYGLGSFKPGQMNIDNLPRKRSKKILGKDSLTKAVKYGIWSGENVISGKKRLKIPVSQVIISHKNTSGEVEYISTIMRDISKQKNTELDLIYKNTELDTFVYRASHDLRGPIASLLGLYNIVKYEIKDETALGFFDMYNVQIKRLNDIILSLIEITKIKDVEATKTDINFEEIIDGSIISFSNLPNFKLISFNINISQKQAFVSDRTLVTTIVQNLIENAIKYSNTSIKPFVHIEVKTAGPQEDLHIIVSDNGIGIPAHLHAKVFNMFFRGTEQAIGSGLGLYIVKNAVEKLKGKVLLKSEEFKGTTFEIVLPNTAPKK